MRGCHPLINVEIYQFPLRAHRNVINELLPVFLYIVLMSGLVVIADINPDSVRNIGHRIFMNQVVHPHPMSCHQGPFRVVLNMAPEDVDIFMSVRDLIIAVWLNNAVLFIYPIYHDSSPG